MESRRVGRSGLQVSEIGLGSWLTIGSKIDPGQTQRMIEVAFDLGIHFFDMLIWLFGGVQETQVHLSEPTKREI